MQCLQRKEEANGLVIVSARVSLIVMRVPVCVCLFRMGVQSGQVDMIVELPGKKARERKHEGHDQEKDADMDSITHRGNMTLSCSSVKGNSSRAARMSLLNPPHQFPEALPGIETR